MISREPDKKPVIDMEAYELALRHNLIPAVISCDEPEAKVGDAVGVQFWAFLPSMPRVGEGIRLEDGTYCIVTTVTYMVQTMRFGATSMISGTANIRAIAVRD